MQSRREAMPKNPPKSMGEFYPDYADDYSDEANEISEAVLGF